MCLQGAPTNVPAVTIMNYVVGLLALAMMIGTGIAAVRGPKKDLVP